MYNIKESSDPAYSVFYLILFFKIHIKLSLTWQGPCSPVSMNFICCAVFIRQVAFLTKNKVIKNKLSCSWPRTFISHRLPVCISDVNRRISCVWEDNSYLQLNFDLEHSEPIACMHVLIKAYINDNSTLSQTYSNSNQEN